MPEEVREHLTRDQRSFLHPESLQILQIHRSMTVLLQFISLIFYRVQVRGHLMRDQRSFLHPESLQILQIHRSMTVLLQFISLMFYRVQVRGHLMRDQRSFLHPESLQILQIHSSMTVLLQFISLMFYRVQDREHLTRDQRHSFIQNHSRSFRFTAPWRCFFSSSHSCSTGFRSENTWWETRDIPSSRITPDPSDSQIHDGASSVHLTHLLQGSGQRTPDERPETFLHPESLQIL